VPENAAVQKQSMAVDDTAIVGENVDVVQAGAQGTRSALSWSAVIAGALAAFAISFIPGA
jgi:hypothetical protein